MEWNLSLQIIYLSFFYNAVRDLTSSVYSLMEHLCLMCTHQSLHRYATGESSTASSSSLDKRVVIFDD